LSAPVRIEARAWNDPRFRTLARLTGLGDPDFAIIKVARIWSWQTERFGEDRDAYVVDRDTVESILGDNGWDALVRSKLADEVPGGLRMRGTEGQIEWCADLTSKRQHAGRARAAKARRDDTGRMIGNTDNSHPAHAGCAGPANNQHDQQSTSIEPPQSSAPTPVPEEALSARPRGIPPTAVPSTEYDYENPRHRGKLAEDTFGRVSAARLSLAREFGLPDQLPFPQITPASQPQAFRDLSDRVREEGASAPHVCNIVVESLIAEARETKSIEWVSLKAFSSGAWNTARERVPGWRKARAGPGLLRISSPSDDPDLSNDPYAPRI
jgi:hypothetical protein